MVKYSIIIDMLIKIMSNTLILSFDFVSKTIKLLLFIIHIGDSLDKIKVSHKNFFLFVTLIA